MRSPIFLVGAKKSGISLLRMMLCHHPEIYCLHPHDFLFLPEGKMVKDPFFQAADITINHTLEQKEKIDDLFEQQKKRVRKPLLVVTLHESIDQMLSIYPQARCIFIRRDPRALSASFKKSSSIWQGIEHFQKAEHLWQKVKEKSSLENHIECTLEDLVENPYETLKVISYWMGLQFSKEMLDYHKITTLTPPDLTRANKWTKTLSPQEIAMIEEECLQKLKTPYQTVSKTHASYLHKFFLRQSYRLKKTLSLS